MIVTIVKASQSVIRDGINCSIKVLGDECNLNFIDTELITNMKYMFKYSKFNGDISSWNVENVTDMMYMFYGSKFNGDISSWNVENVTGMSFMFYGSKFNGDISDWDVRNVTDMRSMFDGCPLENRHKFQPKFKKEQYYDSNYSKGQSIRNQRWH